MRFFKVKNRPLFVISLMIVLWLIYINVLQRYPLQEKVEYLNNGLMEYSVARPEGFDDLALGLSSNLGTWDDTQHRVVTLLRPEHCEVSYWMRSAGSNSLARVHVLLWDLDIEGMTAGGSTVEVFLHRDAPPITVEMQAQDMTVEQCETIGGYYSGGCRYNFETRAVRFFTLNPASFAEALSRLIRQCGGEGQVQALIELSGLR